MDTFKPLRAPRSKSRALAAECSIVLSPSPHPGPDRTNYLWCSDLGHKLGMKSVIAFLNSFFSSTDQPVLA
jgi:hypothetical protein